MPQFTLRPPAFLLAAGVLVTLSLVACSDDSVEEHSRDAGTAAEMARPDSSSSHESPMPDARAPDAAIPDAAIPDAGVQCCPISDEPDCCMHYGGSVDPEFPETSCGETCDGMSLDLDRWIRTTDEHGCPLWVEPTPIDEYDCCGCGERPEDAGTGDGAP